MKAEKGPHGWVVQEDITHNGKDYTITTMKRYDGRIKCRAVELDPPDPKLPGLRSHGASNAQFLLFETGGKATEKSINQAHTSGMKKVSEVLP